MKEKAVKIEIFFLHVNGLWTYTRVSEWHFEKEKVSKFCGNHRFDCICKFEKEPQALTNYATKRNKEVFK